MAKDVESRTCPETGKVLTRGIRPVEFSYKGHTITLDQPGWYATDGGLESLHSGKDMSATQGAFEDFKARVDNVLPAKEAKAIRKKLKLSQREASELLGGGPRSFQKYEAGTVRLSVAMSNLLRLLARDPTRVQELRDVIESDKHVLEG
jgi:HTH-type transcriptional regulator/antitoxin MqsA